MTIHSFFCIGEAIHTSRLFRTDGPHLARDEHGRPSLILPSGTGKASLLPIPRPFQESSDWHQGRVKPCAVAIWQGLHGDAAGRAAGIAYLQGLARLQEAQGAACLDVNVDAFSADLDARIRAMTWTVDIVQQAVRLPLGIDSSNGEILEAGLAACEPDRGRPLVNSVSLERQAAIATAARYRAAVIATAAGESGMPASAAERVANLARLIPLLQDAGLEPSAWHLDPLVYPIAVDSQNGNRVLEAVTALRETYGPAASIVPGISNISFGMPNRKQINQVFAWLAVRHGATGGIADPAQINPASLAGLDSESPAFRRTADLLTGRDEYGMAYLEAFRAADS